MNPSRVTNADIDTDYAGVDREKVKEFILRDHMNLKQIRSSEIITFNTIALKGAIRDVCRALYATSSDGKYSLGVPSKFASCPKPYIAISDYISKNLDTYEQRMRKEFPEVFSYADIVSGTIVSIGTHPSGCLVSDLDIDEEIGLCSTSTSDYPVSMINMKELDDLFYVKLDILGLDNIGVINETCKLVGIERLTPDNVDLDDEEVWKSIRDDTTLIFQWESNSAQAYLKQFMSDSTLEKAKKRIPNFSMLKWMSFGNGLIRPACASFRDSVANGEFYDNGFSALNEFLAPESGRIAMQETIMQFLVKFCGYSAAESDSVRRAIAKKKGTETLLPEIERRFIEYSSSHYDISESECENVIKPFLQIILDASEYGFSWNHSDAYSCIGYISGYLRYYYPYEFLTAALNTFSDDTEKTVEITKYALKRGIQVVPPKWGVSQSGYYFDKQKSGLISKGLSSVKYMSDELAQDLYRLASEDTYSRFIDLLGDLDRETCINTRQLDILIKIGFFSDFGNQRELLRIAEVFYEIFKRGSAKKISKDKVDNSPIGEAVARFSVGTTKSGTESKSYTLLDIDSAMKECEDAIKSVHMEDLSDILKVQNFVDVMGYVGYISGRKEDRPKLYVMDTYPLKRKSDGKQFGYSVITKSIGSGKESRFSVFNRVYDKDPIKKGDIILCKGYERNGQYFTMTSYEKVY